MTTDATPVPETGTSPLRGSFVERLLGDSVRARVVVAAVLAVAGVAMLVGAATRDRLWWLLLWFALGIALLAISMLSVNDELADRAEAAGGPDATWWVGFVAITSVGAAALAAAVVWEWYFVIAAAGAVVLTVGVTGLFVGASHRSTGDSVPSRRIGPVTALAVVVMVLAVVVVAGRDRFDGVSWAMVLVWIVGLTALKIGVVPLLRARGSRQTATLAWTAGLTVVGVVMIYAGSVGSNIAVVLFGVTAAIGALSVFGLATLFVKWTAAQRRWLMAAALAVAAVGWIWTWQVVNGWQLGLVLALFVWGIGTWYVFRGEGIILILLVGFVAAWGLVDRNADEPADPNPAGEVRLLALGDSFISGEGARTFLEGTNRVGEDRNECRRAPTAYPYLLAADNGYRLDFVACSGARMRDLNRCGQMLPDAVRCRDDEAEWAAERGSLGDDIAGRLPQLVNYSESELQEFDVVLVSIGGNDVGFSDIVQACLLPKDCSERADLWLANVVAMREDFRATFARVRESVGDDAAVVVMPYPRIVSGAACGLGLSAVEHEFVVDFIEELAGQLRGAAADAGVRFFEGSLTAFDGVQLCDDPAGANHLRLDPPEGDWTRRYLPNKLIHNSMHPNELGHERIFAALDPYVEALVAGADPDQDSPAVDGPDEPSGRVEDQADEAQEILSNDEWISEELYRTARALVLPLALLLVAGVAFAAGFVREGLASWIRPRKIGAAAAPEPSSPT